MLSLVVDGLRRTGALPNGTYLYQTCLSGKLEPADDVFTLMACVAADWSPDWAKRRSRCVTNNERLGFPGIYEGQAIAENGALEAQQTSFVSGLLFQLPEYENPIYRDTFIRVGLIGAALRGAPEQRAVYAGFKEAFCNELLAAGVREEDAAGVVGENYNHRAPLQVRPFSNDVIQQGLRQLAKAWKRGGVERLRGVVDQWVYGRYGDGSIGLMQALYTEPERRFIGTVLRGRFRCARQGLEDMARQPDYRYNAEKLLAHAGRRI